MAFEYAVVLTGGIATGKSSVAKLLSSGGYHIIDADTIAHEILDAQHEVIASIFGEAFVAERKVDRKALGALVFTDDTKRKQLEALLHPLIYQEIVLRSKEQDVHQKPYFVDIPLYFESKNYPRVKSLVVYASKAQQLERLITREGYTKEAALARIEAQAPIEEKCKQADYVIDNSGTLAHLHEECERAIKEIQHDSDKIFSQR